MTSYNAVGMGLVPILFDMEMSLLDVFALALFSSMRPLSTGFIQKISDEHKTRPYKPTFKGFFLLERVVPSQSTPSLFLDFQWL